MDPSTFIGTTLAGFLSGALVTALPFARRRPSKDDGRNASVHGNQRDVTIDQSTRATYNFIDARPEKENGRDRSALPSQLEPQEIGLIALLAALISSLVFLLVWQFLFALLVGAALVLGIVYLHVASQLEYPRLRDRVLMGIHALLVVVVTAVTAALVGRDGAGTPGMRNLEASVAAELPTYDRTLESRWKALTQNGHEMVGALGTEGLTALATYLVAAIMAALLVLILFFRAVGAWTIWRAQDGHDVSGWRATWATGFARSGPLGEMMAVTCISTVAILAADGQLLSMIN